MRYYIPIFLLVGTLMSFPMNSKAFKLRNALASQTSFSQSITGQVVDGNGNPIENVTVILQGTNKGTMEYARRNKPNV